MLKRIKRNIPQLLRFGVVGSVGAAINFFVYYVASEILHLGVNTSGIFAFSVAVSNNYVLNHVWTFRDSNENSQVNLRQFYYYVLGNIQGLIINLLALNLVVIVTGISYQFWGQALGILLGMLSNFFFAKKIVFNKQFGIKSIPESPSKNIQLFFNVILIGFTVACTYHAILNSIGMNWPWNSFLFMPDDRFNDWHNSVAQAASLNPYNHIDSALATYLPFTYVLLKVSVGYSALTSISIFLFISVALLVLAVGFTLILVRPPHIESKTDYLKDILLLVGACLLSYPALFALDRGNIDLWIGLLSTIFVVTQRSRFELIGLIGLSIAIALKGYPIIFLLLPISYHKYRGAAFCSFLALLISTSTLYFMWNGFEQNLKELLINFSLYYQAYIIGNASLFASSDPYNATRLIYFWITDAWEKTYTPGTIHQSLEAVSYSVIGIYTILSSVFAFITAFFILIVPATRWKKVTAICLIAILFPNVSNDYKLCLLFPGLFLLLLENINFREDRTTFFIFCLLLIPKSYFFIDEKPISMIINPLLLLALAYRIMDDSSSWRQGIQTLKSRLILQPRAPAISPR